jgi:deoxyribodipyrimidine photo-lyase
VPLTILRYSEQTNMTVPEFANSSKRIPPIRIRNCNPAPVRGSSSYVLYWMIANRRLPYNFALDRALEYCRELRKPLVIFEALRCGYQWASDRFHRFVIDGMAENAGACERHRIQYYPYVEPKPGAGKGLLEAFAADACVVITDEFPCFFLPRMVAAAGRKLPIRLEAIDSNGLLPLRAGEKAFVRAFDFRRQLQKVLPGHLLAFPAADPLGTSDLPAPPEVPSSIATRWPPASTALLAAAGGSLDAFPIDHAVKPVAMTGGHSAAERKLKVFLKDRLKHYSENHNHPELDATSNISPYLHFGHISAHQVFAEIAQVENWRSEKLALRSNGAREGWWNMSASSEQYLDQLVTWREVGYNFTAHREDYEQYESLPAWAQNTLERHAEDPRSHQYGLEEFESAGTHDPLWNAAQGQLVREGHIHNYMRMLWGKKIIEWSASPRAALSILIELNNKYGLDGRNPNSYSGIFWCLGRYDRPWGPERPIFGMVRYMSSENTARKFSVRNYIQKFTVAKQTTLTF